MFYTAIIHAANVIKKSLPLKSALIKMGYTFNKTE